MELWSAQPHCSTIFDQLIACPVCDCRSCSPLKPAYITQPMTWTWSVGRLTHQVRVCGLCVYMHVCLCVSLCVRCYVRVCVIIIAATERADILNAAFLRPGRFDRRAHVPEGLAELEEGADQDEGSVRPRQGLHAGGACSLCVSLLKGTNLFVLARTCPAMASPQDLCGTYTSLICCFQHLFDHRV